MTAIVIDPETVSSPPISLQVHFKATLAIDAKEARRRANRQVVTELGTGLIAQAPELVIQGKQIHWRVPIMLSLPSLGDLGQIGSVLVDARTGAIQITATARERMIRHASRLFAGATLQTK
jgi:hypothetical protein